MQIDIKKITDGSMDGQIVWICDYHQPDFDLKPRRNIPPTRVMVVPNGDKKVYYSVSHFVLVDQYGNVKYSKSWAPFDNSGYRSFAGHPVSVFDDEIECQTAWRQQISVIITDMQKAKQGAIDRYDGMIAKLQEQI